MRSKSGAVRGPFGGGEGLQSLDTQGWLEERRTRGEAVTGHQVSKRKEGGREREEGRKGGKQNEMAVEFGLSILCN